MKLAQELDPPPAAEVDATAEGHKNLIARIAIEFVEMPNAEGWSRIAIALALEPGIAPKMQRHLQARAWSVRQQIRKHLTANPGLTQAQIREAALEVLNA